MEDSSSPSKKTKMKSIISAAKDALVPKLTIRTDASAEAVKEGADSLVEPGKSGLVTIAQEVTKNPNAKGFAFEHGQVTSFNANAELQGKPYLAIRVPPGGSRAINQEFGTDLPEGRLGEDDIVIFNLDTGQVVRSYQAKIGSAQYVSSQANDEKYSGSVIVTNSENVSVAEVHENVEVEISYDGVHGSEISEKLCELIAQNPDLSAAIADYGAVAFGLSAGGVLGGGVRATIISLQQSIEVLGKRFRGEEIDRETLETALKEILNAFKSGVLYGVVIKVLQNLMKSDATPALPVAIASIGIGTYPVILRFLKDEISFEEMYKECGGIALTRGVLVLCCSVFPPLGPTILLYSLAISVSYTHLTLPTKA